MVSRQIYPFGVGRLETEGF
jgi:hypothetical protein